MKAQCLKMYLSKTWFIIPEIKRATADLKKNDKKRQICPRTLYVKTVFFFLFKSKYLTGNKLCNNLTQPVQEIVSKILANIDGGSVI